MLYVLIFFPLFMSAVPFVLCICSQAGDVADLTGSTGTGGGDSGRAVVLSLQQTLCALALHFQKVTHPQ